MKKSKNKFEHNWLSKSLENLEKDNWGEIPTEESYLVTKCHKLRKKQLNQFDTEDLRIMIGQNIGLKYLIPIALDTLEKNILIEGDLYEGDLLQSVLTSDIEYWTNEPKNWNRMSLLFKNNLTQIKKETAEFGNEKLFMKAYKEFQKIKTSHNNGEHS